MKKMTIHFPEAYFNWTTDVFEFCVVSPDGKEKIPRQKLDTFKEIDSDFIRYHAHPLVLKYADYSKNLKAEDHIQIFHKKTGQRIYQDKQFAIGLYGYREGYITKTITFEWPEDGIFWEYKDVVEEYRLEYLNRKTRVLEKGDVIVRGRVDCKSE